jgi:hypothetical protein
VSGKVTQNCDAPHKRVNKRVNKRGSRLTSLRSRQGFLGRQATVAALPSQEVVCQEHEHIVSTDRLERASARSVPLQFRSSKCCFLVHACGESRYKKMSRVNALTHAVLTQRLNTYKATRLSRSASNDVIRMMSGRRTLRCSNARASVQIWRVCAVCATADMSNT